jgi:putative peptide zinc metalloprotease protein
MAVELAWFIGRPVANELKVWWRLRDEMRPTRNLLLSGLVAAGLIAVLVVPWQGHVHAPATVRAAQTAEIFPPGPARLEAVLVRDGERVEADMPVYTLASPQLREEIRLAQLQLDALQHEILRRSASLGASAEVGVLEERLAETLADLRGLRAQAARLDVAAPIAGRLTDVPQHLAPGRWLPADQPLGRVVDTASAQVVAYVSAEALARLEIGAAATIYPDELERSPFAATITDIEAVDVEAMTSPWLTSVYGGPIAVRPDRQERLVPVEPVYRVHLSPQDPTAAPERVLTAVARIEGEAESLVARAWRTAASVVIRESGF